LSEPLKLRHVLTFACLADRRAGGIENAGSNAHAMADINAAIMSLHAMTDLKRNLMQPLRVRITDAPARAKYTALARNSSLAKNAVSHLRWLNGLYPDGEPAARQALKIVE
jgi:predicted Zn-dependent protease